MYCILVAGFTPLILAATAGHSDVVEILLDHGADIEAQSERTKDTPLSLACSGGRYEVSASDPVYYFCALAIALRQFLAHLILRIQSVLLLSKVRKLNRPQMYSCLIGSDRFGLKCTAV